MSRRCSAGLSNAWRLGGSLSSSGTFLSSRPKKCMILIGEPLGEQQDFSRAPVCGRPGDSSKRLATGPYSWLYWILLGTNIVVPQRCGQHGSVVKVPTFETASRRCD